ncbi:hypothetical protein [Rhodococcus sp. T7]|uniref:hypothetical protein n=1 Tax=Rhodococcus sp. T7 TaxID=627444 RepID=UPI001F419D2D|nr:hypothetical protein [Rhodococcus sp. T7]
MRGGIAWRQPPAEFPPATAIYSICTRWVRVSMVDAARCPRPRSSTPSRCSARHIAVDSNGLLLAVVVTMARVLGRDGAFRLPAGLPARFSTISPAPCRDSRRGRCGPTAATLQGRSIGRKKFCR